MTKMPKDHNRSCTCSSCFYRSTLEKPSLRQIIAEGSRIDKLYLGKFIPLRKKKIVTTKPQYNQLRNKELQREASLKPASEKVLATSKKEHVRHTQQTKETDSNSVVLGLLTLKNKEEKLLSRKSINVCTCCSCNSSILAREAGTRYVRDVSGKKMYKISRPRKKKELRTVRRPKAKLIRSEPTTKSTLSSSFDRTVKVKSSIYPLYDRQYGSHKEALNFSYGTMGEGNLQTVGAKNVTKRSLITKNHISSGGDKLHTKKTEVNANENKRFLIKNKRVTISTFKSCFYALNLLKKVNAKSNILKSALKDLPNFDFSKSTNPKKAIQLKPKLIQHKPIKLTPKSRFQNKNNKTISKKSIKSICSVKRYISSDRLNNTLPVYKTNISPNKNTSKFNSYIDTFFMQNIMRGKSLNYPKKETVISSTKYGNTKNSSQISTSSRSLTQLPDVNRNYTIKNKHTTEPQSPIQKVSQLKGNRYSNLENVTIVSSPHETNFLIEQKTNDNNTFKDRQKKALHNFYRNSLDKKRRKLLKSTINRSFCKLVEYGNDKNKEKIGTDSTAQAFCEITSSEKSNEQQDKGRKPKYKDFHQHLGSHKRRGRSLDLITSSKSESISSISCDSSIDCIQRTKVQRVKRRQIQHEKCPKYCILKKEGKAPLRESSICSTCCRQSKKNSSIFSLNSKYINSQSLIAQHEWKPTMSVNKFKMNSKNKSKENKAVNLNRYSCRLLKKKDRNQPLLYIFNTAEAGNFNNPMVSPPTPYLSHCQTVKDLQYFGQFSSNSQSSGLFSHKEDNTWHQTMALRDPFKKYACIKKQFSNSYTDPVSYCACLGQHSSRKLLTRSQINHFTNKNKSGIETGHRSTTLSYHHLQQFCVMNLNIVDPKIRQQKLKLFDCEQGVCVEKECDQFKCLNLIHKRLNCPTSTMTSTPVPQVKQKCIQHFIRQQMNSRTLSPPIRAVSPPTCAVSPPIPVVSPPICAVSPPIRAVSPPIRTLLPPSQVKEKCIKCEQSRIPTYAQKSFPPETKLFKQKIPTSTKQKKDSTNITYLSGKLVPDSPVTYAKNVGTCPNGPQQKSIGTCNQKRDPCKGTRTINQNKNALKGTVTQSKTKDGLTLCQNTREQALIRHDSEHVHPSLNRRQEKRNCFYPPSVPESVQSKAVSNTASMRPRKNRNSFTTVTISGLITVCKKQKGIVVMPNSTCSFETTPSRKQTTTKKVATATATMRKKYLQKGTDPLYANDDIKCKCRCNQKLVTSKPYPCNVKIVDSAPTDRRNTTIIGHCGTKLRSPERFGKPPTAFEGCAVASKSKPYEYDVVSTKRECGVGTIRNQTKSASSATEPYQARNVRFTQKLPKNPRGRKPTKKTTERGDPFFCCGTVFPTDKVTKQKSVKKPQVIASPCSATSLKRCFCTTSLKNSKKQGVYFVRVITRPNNIDYQRQFSRVSSLHKSELDMKQTNRKLYYAPYEFLPVECDPSECIERIIKRKQYKKINMSIDNTNIMNSTQVKIRTNAQFLASNINILSSDKYNKELTHKKSYILSSEFNQGSSLYEEYNIGFVKGSTDLYSDTASFTTQESITDSMGRKCNLGNLTGMTPHLNKHLYALTLETSPKCACMGVDNKKGKVKIMMAAKGAKNCFCQTILGRYECKASNCALGNYNPKMCRKLMKPKRLSPGECNPDDCALGNYNPTMCEKKVIARSLIPTRKGEKIMKTKTEKTLRPDEINSSDSLLGKNNLKKIEKKTQVKSNRPQTTVSRQNTEKAKLKTEKGERKTRQLSHVVQERRFKSLQYPFNAGIAITSSISLNIEFYKQKTVPKLPLTPCPAKDRTCKAVRINNQIHETSVQRKTKLPGASISHKPQVAHRSKCQKNKNVNHSQLVPSTSCRSVSIQARSQQKKNIIRKCFCTLMRIASTKDKKIGAKQMDATVANVGVRTKDKYLEPKLFYPCDNLKKPKTRTCCFGTTISKRSLSTMTDKKTFKHEKCDIKGRPNYKQTSVPERSNGTRTQKMKSRKYDQYEGREKPRCEPSQVKKRRLPRIFSDINIISKLSFDAEVSKYKTGVPSCKSMPIPSTKVSSATSKDKIPSRKTAATKLPSKSTSDTKMKSRNRGQSHVHPSLKRCFCTIKLQKPYAHQQIVNFMTTTITPFNNLKRRLIVQEKSSNSYSRSAYLIHDTIDRSVNDSTRKYTKSKIFNEFLNKFKYVILTKLFCKSLDVKHALTKKKIINASNSFRGNRCFCDSNQIGLFNELKVLYPYNSKKFHHYTSCTMIYKDKRSKFYRQSKRHLHYDRITKKWRHKRQRVTEKVQKDFNKRPNKVNHFLNKLKNTFHSIIAVFHRKKHRDACSRGNNKPKNHCELIKKQKDQIVSTKVDILKSSKSDRQKCHVVNNVDPLKTCKNQPVNPKMIINQQKLKRIKVSSPRVIITDKNNSRHSKWTEQWEKNNSCFQFGNIEIRQNRRKDCIPKCYKHHFKNYQILKCTEYNRNGHKQRVQLALKYRKKKKRNEKHGSACCKDREKWTEDRRFNDTRKMKIEKSKHDKGKFVKERRKSKGRVNDKRKMKIEKNKNYKRKFANTKERRKS